MEFLRFGSSIPGSYWGCCAVCIIQNFNFDPDEKASIQLVDGDGGYPMGDMFAGPTYRDIFLQRLRIGTFSTDDMPNHTFLAVLTEYQVTNETGKKWLALLKEHGFEFIRTVDNSVYTGQDLDGEQSSHKNYLFGLFRNIGSGKIENPFEPPKAWTDLPNVIPEAWQYISDSGDTQARLNGSQEVTEGQRSYHRTMWDKIGPPKLLTKAEVEAVGAPVILAGQRSQFPQESEKSRESKHKNLKAAGFKVPDVVDPDFDPFGDNDCDCYDDGF
jgi:hypothetical protein